MLVFLHINQNELQLSSLPLRCINLFSGIYVYVLHAHTFLNVLFSLPFLQSFSLVLLIPTLYLLRHVSSSSLNVCLTRPLLPLREKGPRRRLVSARFPWRGGCGRGFDYGFLRAQDNHACLSYLFRLLPVPPFSRAGSPESVLSRLSLPALRLLAPGNAGPPPPSPRSPEALIKVPPIIPQERRCHSLSPVQSLLLLPPRPAPPALLIPKGKESGQTEWMSLANPSARRKCLGPMSARGGFMAIKMPEGAFPFGSVTRLFK